MGRISWSAAILAAIEWAGGTPALPAKNGLIKRPMFQPNECINAVMRMICLIRCFSGSFLGANQGRSNPGLAARNDPAIAGRSAHSAGMLLANLPWFGLVFRSVNPVRAGSPDLETATQPEPGSTWSSRLYPVALAQN